MYVVLVGMTLAGRFGLFCPRKESGVWAEYYLDVWAVVLGVEAGLYVLSCTHALLPKSHATICDITGDPTGPPHFLAYVTQTEMDWLGDKSRGGNKGRGSASKGLLGTQGVPCYPAPVEAQADAASKKGTLVGKVMTPAQRKPDGTGFFPITWAFGFGLS
jgi:hypothetical protein